MRVVATLAVVAMIALSGCFGKDRSEADLQGDAEKAIQAFETALGPTGDLQSIQVTGWIKVEAETNGFIVPVQLNPDITTELGPGGAVAMSGKLASLTFTGYCDPDTLVAITKGGSQYDVPDLSVETRNPLGYCTGPGSEELLLPFFEFELVDPKVMTGQLVLDEMAPVTFAEAGKGVEAVYTVQGPVGASTLTITAKGGDITQIIADNDESHLVMDMTYGERRALMPPAADARIPSPVTGKVVQDDSGLTWTGTVREGGPLDDYTLFLYSKDAQVGCTGSAEEPLAVFPLADGRKQDDGGWIMLLTEDGDGTLGKDDQIVIREPNGVVQDDDYKVVFNDDWAGLTASLSCDAPGPAPIAIGLGILAAAFVARRRW